MTPIHYKPFTRGITIANPQTRPSAPIPRATTPPVPKVALRPRDHFINVVMESLLEGVLMPLQKFPLRTSMAIGLIGLFMPVKSADFGAINTEPFINAALWFGKSSLAWAGLGCTWGLMRGLHAVRKAKNLPHADFFGPGE